MNTTIKIWFIVTLFLCFGCSDDYLKISALGYFYDAGQVFAFSKGHPTFEGSGLHKHLEKNNSENPTVKFPDIIEYLEGTEEIKKGYVSQTSINDVKQYVVAPLFLMLRDEIRKLDDITQTKLFKNLDYLKTFEDSFYYAVILLGAFFGFRKFYDNYYESLNLRFYKYIKKPTEQQEKESIDKQKDNLLNKDKHKAYCEKKEHAVGEQSEINFDNPQNGSIFEQEDIDIQVLKITEEEIKKHKEVKLTGLLKTIKEKTGKSFKNNGELKAVIEQKEHLEIIKISRADGVRRKD